MDDGATALISIHYEPPRGSKANYIELQSVPILTRRPMKCKGALAEAKGRARIYNADISMQCTNEALPENGIIPSNSVTIAAGPSTITALFPKKLSDPESRSKISTDRYYFIRALIGEYASYLKVKVDSEDTEDGKDPKKRELIVQRGAFSQFIILSKAHYKKEKQSKDQIFDCKQAENVQQMNKYGMRETYHDPFFDDQQDNLLTRIVKENEKGSNEKVSIVPVSRSLTSPQEGQPVRIKIGETNKSYLQLKNGRVVLGPVESATSFIFEPSPQAGC